uniref:Protein takeout n=2 Tax=Homalodisca liturata TaxID=320908 RepID=A0A1B6IKY9_9HEMI
MTTPPRLPLLWNGILPLYPISLTRSFRNMASILRYIFLLLVIAPICLSETKGGCGRNDPDFSQCVVNRMNDLRPTLKKGLPHLKIGSLDPMLVPMIRLKQGNGPVSIDLISTDQIFRGMINYEITSANIDLQNYKMEFTVTLPWLYVEGESKIEGRILVLPIRGSGHSWSNYTSVSGKAVLMGHPARKDDKEFFNLDKVKFDIFVKKATMHMNNLFNGNQQLGEAVNTLMKENWEVVFQEMKPVVDQTVEALIKDIASKVFKRYSLDEMFPK